MAWNCEQLEERLSEYLDGRLGAAERAEFAAHTASCAKCEKLAARVGGLVARVQGLEEVEEPARLVGAILDQTLGPRTAKEGWRGMLEWMRPVLQVRFAMGAVTVVITMMLLSQALGIQYGQVKMEDLKPKNLYYSADRKANLVYARGMKFFNDLRVVNEIQSRLRPEEEPPAATEPAPATPEKKEPEEKGPKQQNRADEWKKNLKQFSVLATVLGGVAGRSL